MVNRGVATLLKAVSETVLSVWLSRDESPSEQLCEAEAQCKARYLHFGTY